MKFYGRFEVINETERQKSRIFSVIMCICCLILLLGCCVGNLYMLTLLVPMAYLVPAIFKKSNRGYIKEVIVYINFEGEKIKIQILNSAFHRKKLADTELEIDIPKIKSIEYDEKSGEVLIKGKMQKKILRENILLKTRRQKKTVIFLCKKDYTVFCNKIKPLVDKGKIKDK